MNEQRVIDAVVAQGVERFGSCDVKNIVLTEDKQIPYKRVQKWEGLAVVSKQERVFGVSLEESTFPNSEPWLLVEFVEPYDPGQWAYLDESPEGEIINKGE